MYKAFLFLLVLGLMSCEKNINFKLQETPDALVVDAQIESGKTPVVILTKSFSFFGNFDPAIIANAFVRNAAVYMSNGLVTHRLKEYTISLAPGFNAYYYGIDSSSLTTAFTGEYNTNYQLRIVAEGKEYNATTSIPSLAVVPDSIYFKPAPFNEDTNKRVMFIKATDPVGLGNYIRYFTKINNEPFLPGENSVYDDQVIDGITYNVQLPQGIDKNNPPARDDNFYLRGDTVTLKFCNIDRASYKFWSTWEFAFQSVGNPFAQPNTVLGNISNGALGVFCGYASVYRTIIAD